MTKVSTQSKAVRFLLDERVSVKSVDSKGAWVEVQGSQPTPYSVYFDSSVGWNCTCPAYTECSHIMASKIVLPELSISQNPVLGTDKSIEDLLKEIVSD